MSVYVDESRWPFRGQRYCHMIADSHDELLAMARHIGLDLAWMQKPGTYREHFDLSPGMRAKAVRLGALEVSGRELGMRCLQRREVIGEGLPTSTTEDACRWGDSGR